MARIRASSQTSRDAYLRRELRTTIAAAHELGPDYEPQLIDAFIDQVQLILDEQNVPRPVVALQKQRRRVYRLLAIGVALLLAWWAIGPVSIQSHHANRMYSWSLRAGTSPAAFRSVGTLPVPLVPPPPPLPPPPPVPPALTVP